MRVELYRETIEVRDDLIAQLQRGEEPTLEALNLQRGVPNRGDYRWRIWESSDVIGASTEGYADRRDMVHNLLHVTGGRLKRIRDKLVLERRNVQRGRLVRFEVKDLTGDDDGV